MKLYKMQDMKQGWFIGDFGPSAYRCSGFEVCYKEHVKGEFWAAHFHKEAVEINYLIEGQMKINDQELKAGDIFVIEKNEVSRPEFITDCKLIVVKTPSVPGDKYLVDSNSSEQE